LSFSKAVKLDSDISGWVEKTVSTLIPCPETEELNGRIRIDGTSLKQEYSQINLSYIKDADFPKETMQSFLLFDLNFFADSKFRGMFFRKSG
jgi:hypothetical protein